MELTIIGIVQLVIGAWIVLAGSLRSAFMFLLISGMFDGSAAILLPALGGSSIPPIQFALLFISVRILSPRGGFIGLVPASLVANRWLALFVFYGMASAFLAPRIFAGSINVPPMHFVDATSLFYTLPLSPSSQNITACVYLLGTLLMAMAAWIACRFPGGGGTLISASILIGWLHIATGLLAVVTRGTPFDAIFDVFRNSNYSQMNDELAGFVRIKGVLPEASSYAGFAFGYFVFTTELWYRSIRPKATGAVAAALGAILVFSTSSTAYVALAAYLAFFTLRILALPRHTEDAKNKQLALIAGMIVFIVAIALVAVPKLTQALYDMINTMTVGKSDSDSGRQRLFWAMTGWKAFLASFGLGIGPGSFRSSSMFLAILGSTGAIGITTFLLYILGVLQPGRRSTWLRGSDFSQSLGGACATSAVLGLIPQAVGSPQAYPGAMFAILAGAALALRPAEKPVRNWPRDNRSRVPHAVAAE